MLGGNEMSKGKGRLRALFNKRREECSEKHPGLTAKLVEWGSAVILSSGVSFWEAIQEQILFKAGEMNISPEEVVEHLFAQKDAETWMFVFQTPKV